MLSQNPDVTVRRATAEDYPAVLALLTEFQEKFNMDEMLSAQVKEFQKYKDPAQSFAKLAQEYLEKLTVFLAFVDNQPVGYICGKATEKREHVLDKQGHIEDWFVTQSQRGKGIGSLLFEVMIEDLKKQHCTHLAIESFVDNTKVIATYEKMGFIKDSILLKKKL